MDKEQEAIDLIRYGDQLSEQYYQKPNTEHNCSDCAYTDGYDGACTNAESEWCADWCPYGACGHWKPREEQMEQ